MKKPSPISFKIRWWMILLIVLVVLVAGVRLSLRSDWLLGFLKNKVENTVSDSIHGSLSIGRITGDLWSGITIKEIRLYSEEKPEPLLVIDSVKTAYSVRELLFRPVSVRKLHLYGIESTISQDYDGDWNVMALLPESETVEESDDSESSMIPFIVKDLVVQGSNIELASPLLLPGAELSIRGLDVQAVPGWDENGFFATLKKLEFSIHEQRLESPLVVQSSAEWDGFHFTLEQFVLAGAASMLRLEGHADTEAVSGKAELRLSPLAWKEVYAWVEEYPVRQDVRMDLTVGGSKEAFRAELTANAAGMEQLAFKSQWKYVEEPVLEALQVSLGHFDLETLTEGGMSGISLNDFSFNLDGAVYPMDPGKTHAEGRAVLHALKMDEYGADRIDADIHVQGDEARMNMAVSNAGEEIHLAFTGTEWYQEHLKWAFTMESGGINPALWLNNEAMDGELAFKAGVQGRGVLPDGEGWTSELEITHFRISDYPAIKGTAKANIFEDRMAAESVISSGEASIETQSEVNWGQDDLEYSLKTILAHADLSVLPGLEHLATDISGIIELKGAGTEPEKMLLSGNLDFNRSVINGQRFETAKMDFWLEDGWLEIEDGRISGSSADASLFLRQHILEPANMDNRMRFQLELKDVSGFANLAGAEEFQVLGEIGGRIRPDERGDLVVEADVALRDVVYDSITVHRVHGKAAVLLSEVMEYIADLEIQDPSYGAYSMADIRFIATGTIDEEVISGSYDFRFNVEAESGLRTRANYTFDGEAGDILVHQLELRDPAGAYSLKKPLSITMAPGSIQADTLILISNTGSEFIMNIEQESHSRWSGFIESREADLGQAQYVFLEEPFFEALFSGRLEFSFDTDDINLVAKAELSEFRHSYIELDTIQIETEIINKELEGALRIWKNEALLMQSAWSIPFDPGMLEQPDAEWLDQAVYASIQIEPVSLADFSDIMEMMGLEDLRGRLSMNSTLSGTAGVPELEGQLYLHNGRVSGVQMDTLQASWAYEHEHGGLRLTSRIHTMGQIAADIQANIPLHIDIPNRTAAGPEQDDAIEASIFTDNFNLAAFNDFLDPGVIRGLQGRLNAEVDISGKVSEPLIRGQVELSEGQFRLVENNVTIRQIESVVRMTPEEIVLERFSAQSSGSLEGSGRISMEGLEPGALQLGFRANNFRVFNTRDIEIFAGLNITLSGSLEAPLLAGNVIWERGTIFLDGFGERDIEVVQLEGEEEIRDIPDFFDRLEMDMTFMVDRNAFVRTRRDPEIFLAPRGEIDLVKEPYGELQLFGDMGISSGHVTTFNKRFRLERGDVQFSGDPMDPEMNIRTLYQPRQQYEDINIYFNITGTLSDPEFTYDSDPEMELQDIISYTLFGRPFHALAGWEQTVTGRSDGSLATNIALDILLDRIETLAADRLGIDVIEIESNNQRGSGGTTIKAGKFVSDRLFVAFLQELGGSDAGMQMMIEYMIRRNLDLIITAGDDYRSGVDVLWRFDY